jgi:hypothetical protein
MFALNFDIIYLFEFSILIKSMMNDETMKMIMCDYKYFMHEMLNLVIERH